MHVESVTLLPLSTEEQKREAGKALGPIRPSEPRGKRGRGQEKQKRDRNSRQYLHTSSTHQRSHTKRCIEVEGFTEGKIESRENRRRRRRRRSSSSSSNDATFATANDTQHSSVAPHENE